MVNPINIITPPTQSSNLAQFKLLFTVLDKQTVHLDFDIFGWSLGIDTGTEYLKKSKNKVYLIILKVVFRVCVCPSVRCERTPERV